MILDQSLNLPGVIGNHGFDLTSDLLNISQQFTTGYFTEVLQDLIKYPGFSWGLQVGDVVRQNITITSGAALDQLGVRLYHPSAASYKISVPAGTPKNSDLYLCVKSAITSAAYKVHPVNGTRHPTETVVGLEFFISATTPFTDSHGNKYPSDNNGLIICKMNLSGVSYQVDNSVRSPNLTLKNG
jgi:hypothetical protein